MVPSKVSSITTINGCSNKKMKEIPCDLLPDILNKLPTKSLCRFKCVSKRWHSLIQDQVSIHKTTLPFKCLLDDGSELYLFKVDENGLAKPCYQSTPPEFHRDSPYLERNCNGLIFSFSGDSQQLGVFNSTTLEFIQVPIPPWWRDDDNFDFQVYFGFVPMLKKYKVLLWIWNCCGPSDFKILTLDGKSSWRSVHNTLEITSFSLWGTNINGSLFWDMCDGDADQIIISFDLVTEEFRRIELPSKMNREYNYSHFEFEGSLCWAEQSCVQLEIVNLWMLKDIENSVWAVMMKNIILPMEGTNFLDYFSRPEWWLGPKEAHFSTSNGELLIIAFEEQALYVFLYSFVSCKFKRIKITGLHARHNWVRLHMENHVSLTEFLWHPSSC